MNMLELLKAQQEATGGHIGISLVDLSNKLKLNIKEVEAEAIKLGDAVTYYKGINHKFLKLC